MAQNRPKHKFASVIVKAAKTYTINLQILGYLFALLIIITYDTILELSHICGHLYLDLHKCLLIKFVCILSSILDNNY